MFGRSKKKQAPEQMQVSAEALALLQAMQTNQQTQPPPMQQPQMMPQDQMMAQQQMMQQQAMQQQMMQQQAMQQQMMAQQAMQQQAMQPQMPQQPQMMPQEQLMAGQAPIPSPEMSQQPQMMAQDQMMPQEQMMAGQAQTAAPMGFASQPDMAFGAPLAGSAEQPAPSGKLTRAQKKAEKKAAKERKKQEAGDKKADKAAAAKEKKEEKIRAKRRKKLAKTRFSRARYLREANGNAIAGVVLWVFLITAFIVGPVMLNIAFLIPQTNENLRIINEVDGLRRSIELNQPQIAVMSEKRKQKEGQIASFTTSFIQQEQAKTLLENFVTQLEDAGMAVTQSNLANTGLTATSIIGVSAALTVEGNYLDWLRVRNKFIREQRAISIPNEAVKVSEDGSTMVISAQIIVPASK